MILGVLVERSSGYFVEESSIVRQVVGFIKLLSRTGFQFSRGFGIGCVCIVQERSEGHELERDGGCVSSQSEFCFALFHLAGGGLSGSGVGA